MEHCPGGAAQPRHLVSRNVRQPAILRPCAASCSPHSSGGPGALGLSGQDGLGCWTIGIGHLIDWRKGGRLPDAIIDALFSLGCHERTVRRVRGVRVVQVRCLPDPHPLRWAPTLSRFKARERRTSAKGALDFGLKE